MASAPKTVTLLDKEKNEVVVSTPADITNLVYGSGYKVKGNMTPEEASALLLSEGAAAEDLAATGVPVQEDEGGKAKSQKGS